MSDHTHSAPRRGSFGRVVGLFLLVVIAALVGLYFYSLEARRAGDEAIGQARSYKRTIVADYKRFYECMRSGGAAGSGTTTASAGTAKAEGAATPPGPFSGNVPEKAATPPPAGVPPTAAAAAPAGMMADAPSGASGEVITPEGPAQPVAPGPSASSDSTPPAGLVVYPPYPDYPVYPQAADQPAAHNFGAPEAPSPGHYPPPPQAEARAHGGPAYDARPAHPNSPEIVPAPVAVQPPIADQSAGVTQTPSAGMNLPQQAWPQQLGPGMQGGAEPQSIAALPAQGAERAPGNYPYRPAPNWQAPRAPSYGAYGYRGTSPAQGPQPPVTNRAYSYSDYGGYPYYQRAPAYPQRAYPDQPQAASRPGAAMQPEQAAQQRMQPQTQPAQGMPPWQGTQAWQAAPPWQGIQPGQGTQPPWQGMQRPYAGMRPGVGTQPVPAAMQPQAGRDGNLQYGPGSQAQYAPATQYAPTADWQAPPGTAYSASQELTPNAPPSVRYDQLTASPPPGGPVMQGAAAPRQDQFPPAQVPGAMAGGAPPSSYGASAPQQWAPSSAPPATAPYAPATGYAPQRAPLQPVPPVGAVSSEMNPLVASARQAYSSQRYQDAINSYRTLIAKGDDSPAVYGELGNVLLAAGRPQEAAQAYYEASSRLIDKGQPASVYLLLSHIETYDPLLGAILNRRLASLPRSLN